MRHFCASLIDRIALYFHDTNGFSFPIGLNDGRVARGFLNLRQAIFYNHISSRKYKLFIIAADDKKMTDFVTRCSRPTRCHYSNSFGTNFVSGITQFNKCLLLFSPIEFQGPARSLAIRTRIAQPVAIKAPSLKRKKLISLHA